MVFSHVQLYNWMMRLQEVVKMKALRLLKDMQILVNHSLYSPSPFSS